VLRRYLLRVFAYAVVLAVSPASMAATLALVTDLHGDATIEGGAKPQALSILAEIESGTRVRLQAQSSLVAVYLASGTEYAIVGPALVEFAERDVSVLSGPPASRRDSAFGPAGKDIRIRPVGIAQGGIVLRGGATGPRISLLSLDGTRTLEATPRFRWRGPEGSDAYRFELSDSSGRMIYSMESASSELVLPAQVPLAAGAAYTWQVETRGADGRRHVAMGEFSVASAQLREQAQALRPAGDAPVAQRVAYAAWLEQAELRDEARSYWKALAAERPDDARLKSLAAD
jgi:hypothetical protein